MTSPRQLLLVSALAMTLVGWQTFRYPPNYLALAPVWGSLAFLAGLVCAWCAWRPTRLLTTLSGAVLSTISVGRALALGRELLARDFPAGELEASFVIAFVTWLLVAILFYVSWREYVVPWAIGTEHQQRSTSTRRPEEEEEEEDPVR